MLKLKYCFKKKMFKVILNAPGFGYASVGGASSLGGEVVGVTSEDGSAIASWTESWLSYNP